MSESEEYLFDHFSLSVRPGADGRAEIKLYSNGRPQTLTPQEAKTLLLLVEKQGQFVETKKLAEEVCGKLHADEGVIHTAARGLRRVFNDPLKEPEFITNERKRGYCFLKEVRRAGGAEPAGPEPTQAAEAATPVAPPAAETPAAAAEPAVEVEPAPVASQPTDPVADAAAAPPVPTDLSPEELKDQVVGFRKIWVSASGLNRAVVLLGIVVTLAVSAAVIGGWEGATRYVSLPQLFMLLFAIGNGLPGPQGLRENFREEAGYGDPDEADDARRIAEQALRRYRIYWRGILGSWFLLYVCLSFMEPGNTTTDWNQKLGIATTTFNNLSTAAFVICYHILNHPVEIKAGRRDINDTAWLGWSLTLTLAFLLVEVFTYTLFDSAAERAEPLYVLNLVSGVIGAIGMALYMGRLQSKFLGPSSGLVITLYSYTAIQPLFIFLVSVPENKQVFEKATVALIAVALINIALILKCLLYLYVALLVKSGGLLFYFVKVRRTYLNVDRERREFRKFLKWES
jgi:DNA-binding winged helix-turn-helix (wHTH) protein